MARETKVGLLVGMGVILLIGIIVSDHLALVQQQEPAKSMVEFGPSAANGIAGPIGITDASNPPQPRANVNDPVPANRIQAVPLPGEDPNALPPAPAVPANTPNPQKPTVVAQNNPTPSPTDPGAGPLGPAAKPATPQPLAIHVVKHGDTLYRLADIYYKKASEWTRIQEANPGSVGPKGQLKDGTKLVIPEVAGVPKEITDTGMFAPVDPQTSHGVGDAASVRYATVEEGETLMDIAKEKLGSGQRWKEILDLNKDVIKRPQDLKIGMKLKLPTPAATKPKAVETIASATTQPAPASVDHAIPRPFDDVDTTATATPNTPAPSTRTYTVQAGDTLAVIAAKTLGSRSKWDVLYDANRRQLASPGDLKIGQVLAIPAKSGH